MKIFPVEMVRKADEYTIRNEPVSSVDLMERAAAQCYKWLKKRVGKRKVLVFCGPGNNGGDGLVVARMLAEDQFRVEVAILWFTEKGSEDFTLNLERLRKLNKVVIADLKENDEVPKINNDDIVVDAIFGSGLSRPVQGLPAKVIQEINKSDAIVVAIDTPSGLFSDKHTDGKKGSIVQADYTLSFEMPKRAFLFPENDRYVGEWSVHPIGWLPEFVEKADVKDFLVEKRDITPIYRPRKKYAHKGHFGHALLIAGGYGKMGASVLASMAALKSGVGLLHTHTPVKGYQVIQTAVPEAMVSIDTHEEYFSEIPDLSAFNAIAIGPGIGFASQTKNALKLLIQEARVPLVLDADALTILGENKTWLSFLPPYSILTPHPKEFERLAGKAADDFERNRLQRDFSVKYSAYVVLKGAHTCVSCPDGSCFYNTTGNPGMASGGSGDVLTGMLLGLLAQGYPPKQAAILGTFLHGMAGDLAARKLGYEALTATSIIDRIGVAFKKIY